MATEQEKADLGAVYTDKNGDVQGSLNIATLKVMLQNVLTHIKENGFPVPGRALAVSVVVPQSTKGGISLTIELKIEKVLLG